MQARGTFAFFIALLGASIGSAWAQSYDLLIKGGHVIDPRNRIDAVMDVAIADGVVAAVAAEIASETAKTVVDVSGLFVTPGLVDLHFHAFWGKDFGISNGYGSLQPDGFTLRSGVTTVVDPGSSGWRNFIQFKDQVIDARHPVSGIGQTVTRVLAFLNIIGAGMESAPAEFNLADMDPKLTAMRASQFPDLIVGIKTAHWNEHTWDAVDRTVQAGEIAGLPVMVDFMVNFGPFQENPPPSLEELLLNHLRPGDILTHSYAGVEVKTRISIVDEEGRLRPFVPRARARGILFDLGPGPSMRFSTVLPAMAQGFPPDVISTNTTRTPVYPNWSDMLNVMSMFLNMGMPLQDVIARSTVNPARTIHRDDLGHLSVGASADLAVLSVRDGHFGFVDGGSQKIAGDRKLECELTLRDGAVVGDLNGISRPEVKPELKRLLPTNN